ncbi:MAG: hypothetical protein K0M78_07465 [Brevundimonas sp.]|nr:hypothetical protein [Brevundimonas sp.]
MEGIEMLRATAVLAGLITTLVAGSPVCASDTPSHPIASVTRDQSSWAVVLTLDRADGVLTRVEWLDHFEGLAGPEARAVVDGFLDDGVPDPRASTARLFDLSGVRYRIEGERLILP